MAQQRIGKEKLDGLKTFLATLPELENAPDATFSGQQVVAELKAEILRLMKKGYTLVHIAELMTSQGFEIKSPTLKTYLSRAGGKKKVTRASTIGVAAGGTPITGAPTKSGTPAMTSREQPQQLQGSASGKFSVRPDSVDL